MTNEENISEIVEKAKATTPSPISTEDFSNENISLKVEKYPSCIVHFTATIKENLIKEATKSGVKKVAKDVTLPGFRKGKAPELMILKKYPKAVDEQIKKDLANMAYTQSQRLAKTPPVSQESKISFDVKSFATTDAVFTFQFESEPRIPHVDPSSFSLNSKKEEVSQEKVEETIAQIRQFYATYSTIDNRSVQEGDFVLLDIEDMDQSPPIKVFNDARFTVKKASMADWMIDAVVGMNTMDAKETISRPNDDDSEEIKSNYQPKKVRVTVKKIEEAILPELNDDFALKLGLHNMKDVYSQLQKQLSLRGERTYQQELRNSISKQLLEKYSTFDIPQSLLLKEIQHRMKAYISDPKLKDQLMKDNADSFKDSIMKEAANAIRLFYLCKTIVENNRIKISFDENMHAPMNMIEAMFEEAHEQPPIKDLSQEEQALIFSRKMLSAAEDYLIEQLQKS
ncbi:MAG: trigger factor [Chlamydiales bacterium]|nr:trigger factor [Chlamydiales bacterium]